MRVWLPMLLLSACETIDAGKYAPDPGYPSIDTGTADTNEPLDCSEHPEFNWINFGQAFFLENCNGCHYSETPDRYGAPEEIWFDNADDVWAQKGMVLMVAGGEMPTMPPNGGTTDMDRLKLEIWLTCGEPGS